MAQSCPTCLVLQHVSSLERVPTSTRREGSLQNTRTGMGSVVEGGRVRLYSEDQGEPLQTMSECSALTSAALPHPGNAPPTMATFQFLK